MPYAGTKVSTMDATTSVLLATYNRADLLLESLESILGQTRLPDQIIVIDDGSTDDTERVLKPYLDRITYLKKENGGKPSALNLGLRYVSSTYVWVFDDDDIALPDFLETHTAFLARHPECDFTYSPCDSFSGQFSLQEIRQRPVPSLPDMTGKHYFIWILEDMRSQMPGMLIPAVCYQAVGGFDKNLFRVQDHEMVIRLARRFRAGYVDKPSFALRHHNGVRGPAFATHDCKDRVRVWRDFQKPIYLQLRADLSLGEYLPGSEIKQLTQRQRKQALLQRAYIMANRGLFMEAAEDIFASIQITASSASFPIAAEKRLLSALTLIGNADNAAPRSFYKTLGVAARQQPEALKWLCRGLYWSLRRHITRPRVIPKICAAIAAFFGGYATNSRDTPN